MGNGAAVGDYDGDGWLDVFLAGQAGQPRSCSATSRRRTAAGDSWTSPLAAGLDIRGNVRVAQFVDLGSGRPDLVVATDFVPDKGRRAVADLPQRRRRHVHGRHGGLGLRPEGYIVGGMTFGDFDGSGRQ